MAQNPHAEEILIIDDEFCSSGEQDEFATALSGAHDGLAAQGATPVGFHGADRKANGRVKHEKPWMRIAAQLMATGTLNQTEIANLIGKDRQTVNNLFGQKWFQELVAHLIQENGQDPMRELFRKASKLSYWKLVQMLEDDKTPAATKAKIATDFIERTHGKAPANAPLDATKSEDPRSDAERLYEELEKVNAAKREALARQNQTKPNDNANSTEPSTGPDFSEA